MSKKTILFVYDNVYPFSKGGGEFRIYQLAKYFAANGWRSIWFSRKYWDNKESFDELDGIRIHSVCNYQENLKNKNNKRRSFIKILPFLFGLLKTKIPKNTKIVFLAQTPLLHFFPIFIKCKLRGIPIIFDCWEIWGKFWFKYPKYR